MDSPDEPGVRRRRRRSRRAADNADDPAETESSRTVRRARDETDHRAVGRRGRLVRQRSDSPGGPAKAGRRVEPAKAAGDQVMPADGPVKPTGRRRARQQSSEPSARTIRETERGWRDLAGSGASQLGVSGALRARDVARPGPDELAEAERSVQLVRRQWQPPTAD